MNIAKLIEQHIEVMAALAQTQQDNIARFAKLCAQAVKNGNTVFFMGNGGSAADSQHLAAEFVGRFQTERCPLPALALTTDTSILTAVGNDYGFDEIFTRQVQALVRPGDVVVGISTSGNSPNVLKALETAKAKGAVTVGLTGAGGGKLADTADLCVCVPSDVTARVQEAHILIGHIICEHIDSEVGSNV